MTGRYGNGPRAGARASFSAPDDAPKDWAPKHPVVIRRISKGSNSSSISVRNLLPPEWDLVRIMVVMGEGNHSATWKISRLDTEPDDDNDPNT